MKFMVQMNVKKGPYQMEGWSPDDVKRMMGFMDQLNADLKAKGQWVTATISAGATTRAPPMSPSHQVRQTEPNCSPSISPPARRLDVPMVALTAVLITAPRSTSRRTSTARSSDGRKPATETSR